MSMFQLKLRHQSLEFSHVAYALDWFCDWCRYEAPFKIASQDGTVHIQFAFPTFKMKGWDGRWHLPSESVVRFD